MISPAPPIPAPDFSQIVTEAGPFTQEAIRRLWMVVANQQRPVRWAEVNSLAATPWEAFTTTWANTGVAQPAIGNGAQASAYYRLGTTIQGYIAINFGGTTTYGDAAGVWTFTLPSALGVSAADVRAYWIPTATNTPRYFSTTIPSGGSAVFSLYTDNGTAWSPSVPVAPASGDKIRIYFSYREA